jgi:hypothetical protein
MQMFIKLGLVLFIFHTLPSMARAADFDSDAIAQTQASLRNKTERQKVINSDPKARQADQELDKIAGTPENKDELYEISAELTPWLAQTTNGDPEAMAKLLQEALGNPEAFYKKIPNAQKEKIKALTQKIEYSKLKP